MSATKKNKILLLGGTGKVASRIAPLLSYGHYSVLLASRSGQAPPLPNCQGVKFDWFDETTYDNLFRNHDISTVLVVMPPILNQLPFSKTFLNHAMKNDVTRVVLLSASPCEVGKGPMMGAVAQYLISLGLEYAILRPSWFMENFSEM